MYDFDFDHEFLEAEKYDAKRTYKKFLGYSPGVGVIGNLVIGIENRDGNANVRFHQQDTLERMFTRLESRGVRIKRARMDCGSCAREIVETVSRHCEYYYIRGSRCQSIHNEIFALRGWKRVTINGKEFEVCSIRTEKWMGCHAGWPSSARGGWRVRNLTCGRENTPTAASSQTTMAPRMRK